MPKRKQTERSTGIYRRIGEPTPVVKDGVLLPGGREALERCFEQMDEDETRQRHECQNLLSIIEQKANAVLAKTFEREGLTPAQQRRYKSIVEEQQETARILLIEVAHAQWDLKQGHPPKSCMYSGFILGRLFERLLIRKFEPLVLEGRRTDESRKRGGLKRTSKDNRREVEGWAVSGRAIRAKNPALSDTAVRARIANEYGVSESTVRRNFKKYGIGF